MNLQSLLAQTTVQAVLAFAFAAVASALAIRGDVSPDLYMQQVATIIAFFFGVKAANGSS